MNIDGNTLKLQIQLKENDIASKEEKYIKSLFPKHDVQVIFFVKQDKKKKFKKIFGVCSGKGGVGKSTISTHIAFALKEFGYKVGILDADIYSPSIPVLLNLSQPPVSKDGNLIEPVVSNGIQVLSMGLFLQNNQTCMWKDGMQESAFRQFLEQANWDCDYLIIDFPPGNTPIYNASLALIKDMEMILISTLDKLSYSDVMRFYVVLKANKQKILGVINNKSYLICDSCKVKKHFVNNYKNQEIPELFSLPVFNNFEFFANNGYKENYQQQEEKELFQELVKKII